MSALVNGIATEREAAAISGMEGVTSDRLVTRTNLSEFFCRLKAPASQPYETFQCVKHADIEKAILRFYLRDAISNTAITSDTVQIVINGSTHPYTRVANLYTVSDVYLRSFSLYIKADGYKVYNAIVTFDNLIDDTIALVPESSTAEVIAYVNWNHNDSEGHNLDYDIDTHVVIYGPDYESGSSTLIRKGEVQYDGKSYEDANIKVVLDIDDTGTGDTTEEGVTIYGETITVTPKIADEASKYVLYYIQYDYEHRGGAVPNPFSERETSVRVIDKTGNSTTFTPPETQTLGRYWRVFSMQNGTIISTPNEVDDTNVGNWQLIQGL